MTTTVRVLLESTPKRVFVSALDWPGWSRSGRDEDRAVEAFLAAAARYSAVARQAGEPLDVAALELEVVERVPGDRTTEFGVPSAIAAADRRASTAAEAARLASLVEAAWAVFDRTAAGAPAELRKGPRGGGRDTAKIVEHVTGADEAYAGVMGIPPAARHPVEALRETVLGILREPSDGSPIAGRRWPPRYAARRIAWHALDHAWEIEDRAEA